MKYEVINQTTGELIETDNILVAYKWAAVWEEMEHCVEMIDNEHEEVVINTKKD